MNGRYIEDNPHATFRDAVHVLAQDFPDRWADGFIAGLCLAAVISLLAFVVGWLVWT